MNILKVTVLFPIWSLLLPFNVQIFPQNQILFRVIINGEEKRTNSAFVILVSEHLPTGEFKVAFNVHQLPRVEIPSGVYFYQLEIRYPITCSLNEQGSPQVTSSGQAITPTKKRFSLNNIFSIFI